LRETWTGTAGIVSTSDPASTLTLSATLAKCRSTLVDFHCHAANDAAVTRPGTHRRCTRAT
jgi:hypothetical protein